MLIENVHFKRQWSSASAVGRKAVAVNVSDVEAMGARPSAVVVALAFPKDLDQAWVAEFEDGVKEECATAGRQPGRRRPVGVGAHRHLRHGPRRPRWQACRDQGRCPGRRRRGGLRAARLVGCRADRPAARLRLAEGHGRRTSHPERPVRPGHRRERRGRDGDARRLGRTPGRSRPHRRGQPRGRSTSTRPHSQIPDGGPAGGRGHDGNGPGLGFVLAGGEDHALAATSPSRRPRRAPPPRRMAAGSGGRSVRAGAVLVDGARLRRPWEGPRLGPLRLTRRIRRTAGGIIPATQAHRGLG